jgi:hypothetical protein
MEGERRHFPLALTSSFMAGSQTSSRASLRNAIGGGVRKPACEIATLRRMRNATW